MANKVRTKFIFEILGKPPEHIKTTMNQFIDKLEEIKEVKIEERVVHEPKLIEEGKRSGLYTTFAEVELTTETLAVVVDIVLHMLPSHVEILEPTELKLKNFDLSSLLSNLTIKIHKYDEIAKASLIERDILKKKLDEMQEKIDDLEKGKKNKTTKKPDKKKSKKKSKKK
jgi:hypothetical protein